MRIKTTPHKMGSRNLTPIKSQIRSTPRKSSFGSRSPAEKSYFRTSGIKRSVGKAPTFDDILTIEELLDVPMFLPSYKTSVVKSQTFSPYLSRNITPIRNRNLDSLQKVTISQIQDKFRVKKPGEDTVSIDTGFRRRDKELKTSIKPERKIANMEDVLEGVRKGVLTWDQLIFNKSAFEYLKRNTHLLE